MPAPLPGATLAQNLGNPSQGRWVMFDPLSGPKGSPLDRDNSGNASTGALCTGIGFGDSDVINITPSDSPATAPQAIFRAGFNDNNIVGEKNATYSAGGPPPVVATSTINSTIMYIGGGKMTMSGAVGNQVGAPTPYTAGIAICGAGNGGSRDGGAGPAFTGFPQKMVTATAGVANGAAVEAGWNNRSGVALVATQSVYGSSTTQLAAPS
jgi:hypothetical protein